MATEWVDFKEIKDAVNMQMVLDHYGIKSFKQSGDELRGPCPIHKGSGRSKNFSVNVHKNAFKCFSEGCGARGNVLDFVAAMELCSVRDAALKLQKWFGIGETESSAPKQIDDGSEAREVSRGIYSDPSGAMVEVIATASSAEDFEPLVVYRELFGEYRFWVTPAQNFSEAESHFTLVKAL